MVKVLRETEKADVIVALSHGGMEKETTHASPMGRRAPAKAVPGIDVARCSHRE